MEKEKMESLIIDYIDNKLNTVDRQKIELELANNPDAYKLYEELREILFVMDKASALEPTAELKSKFDNLLQAEIKSAHRGKYVLFTPLFYRAAAAVALLVVGGGIGFWISQQNDQQKRMAAIEKQMEQTKSLMLAMLENQQSASQRMQGISVAQNIERADTEIIRVLLKTMDADPNTNVRLAALEALSKFSGDTLVRTALIRALSTQKDPVVQIALIQLLVKMKEKGVVNDLQRIIDNAQTIQPVKDEAYSGILRLS